MPAMTRPEMIRHLRGRLKAHGIKARVRQEPASRDGIQVIAPSFDRRFDAEQCRTIALIADSNGLTYVYGLPIELRSAGSNCDQFDFKMPAAR